MQKKTSLFQQFAKFLIDRFENFEITSIGQMQIIVHNVMRDCLITLNDMFMYRNDVHVFSDVIADYVFVCELVYEINVDFDVSHTTGIRILSSRQQSLKKQKRNNTK